MIFDLGELFFLKITFILNILWKAVDFICLSLKKRLKDIPEVLTPILNKEYSKLTVS